jgi:hypothetical protein
MTGFGRAAALVITGLALTGGIGLGSGTASAAQPSQVATAAQAPILGYTLIAVRDAQSVSPAAQHWYVKGRLGSFNIRESDSATSRLLQTVPSGQGAWCWNQTTDCGAATAGGSYRCSSTTPVYTDWLPVATSSQARGWVARHCVFAVHQ